MKKHKNIPIFIPHLGCPNQCVFCNQRTISGHLGFDITTLRSTIDEALSTISADTETEIAFFGGSFTGIDRELMINLLSIANEYIDRGKVNSIRCSTRPDYINDEILDILEKYRVKTIELGLQSISEGVLSITKRGHSFLDEENACTMIVERGFNLIGQMMIGLPGSTLEDELATAEFIIRAGAAGARIYPTVVFSGTELYDMAIGGMYAPLSETDAIERSARVLELFVDAELEVIRIGLCAQDNLYDEDNYFAGPAHSALGELVIGELYFNKISKELSVLKENIINKSLRIFVSRGSCSKAIGQKRKNITRLVEKFHLKSIAVKEDGELSGYELKIDF